MRKSFRIWLKLMDFGEKIGCHQMAERSFFFKGYQFPVCARCTGVLFGELVALILLLCSVKMNIILALALLIPMGIDWGLQHIKVLMSDNIRRLITGTLGGVGLTFVYFNMIILIIQFLKG